MNLFRTLRWCVLAVLFCTYVTLNSYGETTTRVEAVSIENGSLRVTVDSKDGTLLELTDLRSGHNHVGDAKRPCGALGIGCRLRRRSDDGGT